MRAATTAALLVLGITAAGCGGIEDSCVYGSNDQPSGTASVSCKSRPAASAAQTAALRSGAGPRAALKAYAASDDAGKDLIGIGVNAWAETTFTWRGEKAVTYDRRGKELPADKPAQRNYAVATAGSAPVRPADADPKVLGRVVSRVARSAPQGKLQQAVYGSLGIAPGVGWRLTYFGMGAGGQVLIVGDEACALVMGKTASPVKGMPACDVQSLLVGGAGAASGTPSPTPSAPAIPQSPELAKAQEQLACVQAAKGDITKLTKCATP